MIDLLLILFEVSIKKQHLLPSAMNVKNFRQNMVENNYLIEFLDIMPFACLLMSEDYQIKYANHIMATFLTNSQDQAIRGRSMLQFLLKAEQNSFVDYITNKNHHLKFQPWKKFRFKDSLDKCRHMLISVTDNLEDLRLSSDYLLFGIPEENLLSHRKTGKSENKTARIFRAINYDNVFENAVIGIAFFTTDGYLQEANRAFCSHFDFSKSDVNHRHYTELFKDEAKDSFKKLLCQVKERNRNYVKDVVKINLNADKHQILEISLSQNSQEDDHEQLLMISEDITNQKETHIALLQSEKLALTGRLAASLAHEINNPLQTSIGCLGLVDEMLHDDEQDLKVYIKMALEELQRSARIVKQLRDINRKTESTDRMPVDLREIIESVLILTKNRLHDRDILPVFPYQGPPPIAFGSKDQIQQVLLNLVMNAIDAIHKGGYIYLDILETKNPKGLKISVRDTGVGMDNETMNHLFDPFFTTKEDGLGLGLYICRNIIEDHDGTLNVQSEPGKGTEFIIWIPSKDMEKDRE